MAKDKHHRWLVLAGVVAMQTCLGATYAWSVFVDALREASGIGQGPAQLPFTFFYTAFPATMIFSGAAWSRIGPRRCAAIGAALFGGGWVLAGLMGARGLGWIAAGVGLMGGVGVGMAYIVPIAIGMLWFPERKGLVTGVAVAGFGGGAMLVAQIAARLFAHGWSPFQVFVIFGSMFLVLVAGAGSLLRLPPGFRPEARRADAPTVARERAFWILYLVMLAGLAAGFTISANLKQLSSAGLRAGVGAVSLFAICNAVGRVAWGWVFDRLESRTALRANLLLQGITLIAAPWVIGSPAGLWFIAAAAGINYGGVLVLYAATAGRLWGSERVGRVYGLLFSSNIPAAQFPLLAGWVFDRTGGFGPFLAGLGCLLILAIWPASKID